MFSAPIIFILEVFLMNNIMLQDLLNKLEEYNPEEIEIVKKRMK